MIARRVNYHLGSLLLVAFLAVGPISGAELAAPVASETDAKTDPEKRRELRRFARTIHPSGVPIKPALRIVDFPGAPKVLIEILDNPNDRPFWAGTAILLGLTGRSEGFHALTRFARSNEDTSTEDPEFVEDYAGYLGRSSAVLGIGLYANQAPEEQKRDAIRFLAQGLQVHCWGSKGRETKIGWRSPEYDWDPVLEVDELWIHLTKLSIQALGLSGVPEAVEVWYDEPVSAKQPRPKRYGLDWYIKHLDSVISDIEDGRDFDPRGKSPCGGDWPLNDATLQVAKSLKRVAEHAVKTNTSVRDGGLVAYYETN